MTGIETPSILFVTDRFPFPGNGEEDDLYRVDCRVQPSGDIDVLDGTDGQATRGVERSHSTFEVGL